MIIRLIDTGLPPTPPSQELNMFDKAKMEVGKFQSLNGAEGAYGS